MIYIFEVKDFTGRTIYLTHERYTYILKHKDMHQKLEEIQQTLLHPLKITCLTSDLAYYYTYYKQRTSKAKYLRVIVKYLNGKGFIVTSYFVEILQ